MPSSDPRRRLDDIRADIARIELYVAGLSSDAFERDPKTQDAVLHCLLRISEAAVKLGPDIAREIPGPPWQSIRSIGNHIRHAYDEVRLDVIWTVIERDLPALERDIAAYLASVRDV